MERRAISFHLIVRVRKKIQEFQSNLMTDPRVIIFLRRSSYFVKSVTRNLGGSVPNATLRFIVAKIANARHGRHTRRSVALEVLQASGLLSIIDTPMIPYITCIYPDARCYNDCV